MFKILRILVLLFILMSVWGTYRIQQTVAKDWSGAVTIKVIPVIADNKPSTKRFVSKLQVKDFDEVSRYLISNAKPYNLDLTHIIDLQLEPAIESIPPTVPSSDSGFLSVALWSLKLRYWAWQNETPDHESYFIRIYMLYQSPVGNRALPHSTGLQNGLIGLVNARANTGSKRFHNVILTHELLHILGASDKYDLATGEPIYPQGFLNQQPKYPQPYAEIMARAKPLSNGRSEIAETLSRTRIGPLTAQEIAWDKSSK